MTTAGNGLENLIVRYGSGGEQEKKNALCILGLNMINDKIFLVVWFWYFFLLIVGTFRLCYRIVTVSFWKIRSCNCLLVLMLTNLLQVSPHQMENPEIFFKG